MSCWSAWGAKRLRRDKLDLFLNLLCGLGSIAQKTKGVCLQNGNGGLSRKSSSHESLPFYLASRNVQRLFAKGPCHLKAIKELTKPKSTKWHSNHGKDQRDRQNTLQRVDIDQLRLPTRNPTCLSHSHSHLHFIDFLTIASHLTSAQLTTTQRAQILVSEFVLGISAGDVVLWPQDLSLQMATSAWDVRGARWSRFQSDGARWIWRL